MLGCLEMPKKEPISFEEYLTQYLSYMRNEQGLSENTIEGRFFQLKDFLIHVNHKKKSFSQITSIIVDDILTKKYSIDGYSRRSIQSYASVIRSFLKYTENQGWSQKNLADSIKAPRVYDIQPTHWRDNKGLMDFLDAI
jgi:site-specific recombinase XerD